MQTRPSTTTHVSPPRRESRRRAHLVVASTALVVVLMLLAVAGLGSGGAGTSVADSSPASSAEARAAELPDGIGSGPGGELPFDDAPDEPLSAEDAAEDEAPDSGGWDGLFGEVEPTSSGGDDSEQAPVELEPLGEGEGSDPCSELVAGNGVLLVTPDPLVVPSGLLTDSLHVRNCGGGTVDWTALTKPTVSLASPGGTLAPGELTELGFSIDPDGWDPGAVEFKIKVSEPGHNHYVDVHAFRPVIGSDYVATNQLTGGPHAGGCADQCITKAWITTGYSSPDVSLEVKTKVPARIRVYLSTNAPVTDAAGNPVFPGKPPRAISPAGVTSWTTGLDNLQASTRYHIIVRATDEDGDSAFQSGSFKTVTPVTGPAGLAGNDPEPGCANQCIVKAIVTPGEGLAPAHLSVKSHTPARFQASLSTAPPSVHDGVPSFAETDAWANSGLGYQETWETELSGLQPATKYHIIVMATDANGKTSYRNGSFTTHGVGLFVTLHQIHVTHDGDSGKLNRGELSFAWGVGDDTVGVKGEKRMHAGTNVTFSRPQSSYLLHNAGTYVPSVRSAAFERDPDGLIEFCSMGGGVPHTPGSNGDCDVKWNVASNGIHTVHDLDTLPTCGSMGIASGWEDVACMVITTPDMGGDYPRFWAIVSFKLVV